MTTLKIKGLFDISDVTLEIGERCVILLGENGMGKSTMLRMLRDLLAGDFCEMTQFPFERRPYAREISGWTYGMRTFFRSATSFCGMRCGRAV